MLNNFVSSSGGLGVGAQGKAKNGCPLMMSLCSSNH